MESLQIPREVAAFLTEPHLGVLATVSSVGNPQTTVVWYEFRDSAFWFYVGKRSHKARNVRRSPRVSLTIDERQYPYKGVVVYGNAKEVDFDEERACRIAIRYLGQEDGERLRSSMRSSRRKGCSGDILAGTRTKLKSSNGLSRLPPRDHSPIVSLAGRATKENTGVSDRKRWVGAGEFKSRE